MGKGGGNNDKALKLQKQSLRDSREQARRLEKLMKAQARAAGSMVLPKYEGPAAAPTQTTADLEGAATDMRTRNMRRMGLNNTVYAGAR